MSAHLSPESIMQAGLGFWPSKVLLSAIEMELFTDLAKGPQPLESIRGRIGLHPRSARDFLDALVALQFLRRAHGLYSASNKSDHAKSQRRQESPNVFFACSAPRREK